MNKIELGAEIRRLRKEAGISTYKLEKMGLHPTIPSKIETGIKGSYTIDTLIDYLDKIGVVLSVSESLLAKYIEHVVQCEGINFVNKCNDGYSSNIKFSDEEIKILERLS